MADEHPDDILSLDDAAAITPWSASSLYRIAQEGGEGNPFKKIKGRWVTTRADLAAYVRAQPPTERRPATDPMPKPRRHRRRRGSVLSAVHQLREEQHA